jgi:protein-disulfide isomerase
VPLFALANAGIHLSGTLMSAAVSSPITWGILIGYVIGKPIGVFTGSWIASRPALHGPRSPISEPVLLAAGCCAGIGFTVSLLVSTLAFKGIALDEARLGALTSVVVAPVLAWLVTRLIQRLPENVRARQVGRTAEDILDLAVEVDPEYDHIRGPDDAPVTLVEYGDFECPYCGQAETSIRDLLAAHGDDVRYVWRHLPLNDVHPTAQLAAEASEAAAAQGRFWDMYDVLLSHQEELSPRDLARYATDLGLDVERFRDSLRRREYAARISEDVASADESGVSGTPTFFIKGGRHYGVYDLGALSEAVGAAKRRARQLSITADTLAETPS